MPVRLAGSSGLHLPQEDIPFWQEGRSGIHVATAAAACASVLRQTEGTVVIRGFSPVSNYPQAREQTARWIEATSAGMTGNHLLDAEH